MGMDVFYDGCKKAKVNCRHLYIYRDPYHVLASTSVKRHYNKNILEGIRLYTLQLQLIYSQMTQYSEKIIGCFGILDLKGSRNTTDWERFAHIFGWESSESLKELANQLNNKNITPLSKDEKQKLVPFKMVCLDEGIC